MDKDMAELMKLAAKATPADIAKAKALGAEAFKKGKKRIPAWDKELPAMFKGKQVGEGIPLLDAWLNGWDEMNLARTATDATYETGKILPNDFSEGEGSMIPGLEERKGEGIEGGNTQELHEMQELLKKHGYNPHDAAKLQAEGMGPMELEHRLKTTEPKGDEWGGLGYTHGLKKLHRADADADVQALEALVAEDVEAKFEEGKPADPTENLSPEDKKKWEKYHGKVEHLAAENLDGAKVQAKGVFAKGLKDGETYILRKAAPLQGTDTFNFLHKGKVVARFDESQIKRFLRGGEGGDLNGLVKVASVDAEDADVQAVEALLSEDVEARFEEGKPADPTKDMTEEQKKEWWKHHEEHKDNFKEAATKKWAAANTINIVKEFLTRLWPEAKQALDTGDDEKALRGLEMIQSAYFHAAGMNEHVISLSDTSEAMLVIPSLIRVLKEGRGEILTGREALDHYVAQMDKKVVPEWKAILHKYRWQEGLGAERILSLARDILNRGYEELGDRAGRRISDIFFSQGPDAAEAALDQALTAPAGLQHLNRLADFDPGHIVPKVWDEGEGSMIPGLEERKGEEAEDAVAGKPKTADTEAMEPMVYSDWVFSEDITSSKIKGKGDWALVKSSGLDDIVLSLHKTEADAEAAMRKLGGEPHSMFQRGLRIIDVGPQSKMEMIEVFGKWTLRPKTASLDKGAWMPTPTQTMQQNEQGLMADFDSGEVLPKIWDEEGEGSMIPGLEERKGTQADKDEFGPREAKEKWIPKDLEKGRCTPAPNPDCPVGSPQYNLAQTFKKHKKDWKEAGANLKALFQKYQQGGGTYEAQAKALLGDDKYVQKFRMPKWNVQVSVLQNPEVVLRYNGTLKFPTEKSFHAQMAPKFYALSKQLEDEWESEVDKAVAQYGKDGPLISGVYRSHFPDEVKDYLRFLAGGKSMVKDAARFHEAIAKSRSPQFTKEALTVPDQHQLKILKDNVKNPMKAKFLGGPSPEESEKILREKFKFTDAQINSLKKSASDETAEDVEAKFEEGKPADPTENLSPEDKKKWEKYHGKVEHLARQRLSWGKEGRKAEGLYGYTRQVQSDCESATRRTQRVATALAKEAFKKDAEVAPFLSTHSKRRGSVAAQILVEAMKGLGPKVASLMKEASPDTLHWEVLRDFTEQEWEELSKATKALLNKAKSEGIAVAGPSGFGHPIIDINEILLNGNHRESLDGDDCMLTPYEQTYSCDTANKPYGAVVKDILEQAKKIAPDAIRVRVGSVTAKEAGKRKFGLYGYPSKTATLGLATCSALRGKVGEITAEMHSRRADQHEKINGFLERHAREGNCVYSQMLAQCYPEASRRCASVGPVAEWLVWEK